MANPRKVLVAIAAVSVVGVSADLPFLTTRDCFAAGNAEMFDPADPQRSGFTDPRVFDHLGVEVPREVVSGALDSVLDAGDGDLQLWHRQTLLDAADTGTHQYTIEYGDRSLPDYATTDQYGRNAVWSREEVRWHDPSDPVDATGNYTNGNTEGAVSTVAGPWGGDAAGYDGVNDASVRNSGHAGLRLANETVASVNRHVTAWFNADSTSGTQAIAGFLSDEWMGSTRYGTGFGIVGGKLRAISGNANTESQVEKTFTDTTNWHRADLIAETDDTFRFYHNGALVGSGGDSGTFTYEWAVGAAARHTTQGLADGGWYTGSVAETAYAEDAPSAGWITTTWNNQSDPGAAAQAGAPQDVGGAALAVEDASHAHAAEAPALSPKVALAVAGDSLTHAADTPTLTPATPLTIADNALAHGADTPALTAGAVLTVPDATHAHAAESPALVPNLPLAVAGDVIGHAAEHPALAPRVEIATLDDILGHIAESPILVPAAPLSVPDAVHHHAADAVALSLGALQPAPDHRTFEPGGRGRSFKGGGRDRSFGGSSRA